MGRGERDDAGTQQEARKELGEGGGERESEKGDDE